MKLHRVNDKRDYYRGIYLKSAHWANLKRRKLSEVSHCQVCGSTSNLDVHHLRYRNLYDVRTRDLIVLCRTHHVEIHKRLDEVKRKMERLRNQRREERRKKFKRVRTKYTPPQSPYKNQDRVCGRY